MAEGTLIEPAYLVRLTSALQQRLPDAQVSHEQIRRDRYRFVVVSEQFNDLGHPERQRIVWDIADATLGKQDLLNIGMILTLAPADYPETNIE
jgi:acid stress-induced BolA-like protein IbaG/YrbA